VDTNNHSMVTTS